jgi:serine/threonine protein kinase
VLIDFGAARESATRVSRVLSKVLTVKDGYSPQEFYLAGSDQLYSSDLYALAATFYHVVSRKAPPSSHSRLAATARQEGRPA